MERPETVSTPEPGIRRIIAPNPSPMTYWGTNTYVVGQGSVAVIDPGPDNREHLQTILDSLEPGETISHIFVTHSHLDHSPLSRALSDQTGAPVYAFGDSMAGRTELMNDLAASKSVGGGEGVDVHFRPDEIVADGVEIAGAGWSLTSIWTPGHFGNHLSFAMGNVVFTGDHIMDWATSMVSPPDGDLTAFMASTEKLAAREDRVFFPGHGNPVHKPVERARWLLKHRRGREAAIIAALANGPSTVSALTHEIYADVSPALIPAAQRNVFAHLIHLTQNAQVAADPKIAIDAVFSLV